MIGIYKITNKIENKSYIGQSIHIEIRWKQHWYNRGKYPTLISQNLSKFDIEDFDFQIIEECTEEELNVKEEHYIKLFNTFKPFGYNMIWPGSCLSGELNGNAKYSTIFILNLRTRVFNQHEPAVNVYEDVREIMDRTYFYAIIHGTYRQEPGSGIELVKPLQGSQSIGSRNNRAIMNEEMVLEIRNRIYIHQEERLKVWQDYKDIISWSAFNKLICGDSWQHVDTSMIQKVHIARKGVTKAKLTITDVQNIRYQYEILKKDINDIYQQYSNLITHTSFIRVINYQTWKNVKPVSTRPEA